MLISVIITTKNEEKNIGNCLKSVLAQTYPLGNIEIIVVDNNSSDKTEDIVREFQKEHALLNLKMFNQGPERSAQKNFGVKKSSGEFFIHLDADMVLSENVIAECVKKVSSDKNIIALFISEIVRGKSLFSKIRRFEREFYDGTAIDAVRFIKKNKFQEAESFDEALYACEDWDLSKRLNKLGEFAIIKSPLYHNETESKLAKYLKKKEYYSKNVDVYIGKWGKNDPDIKKQFGFYYRYIGVFMEKKKWKKILRHPVLAFGMYSIRLLVGIKFLTRQP
ncbi:MAG: glycosyltransferase [Parcubacteria group bacterium]|jgi:glycosyltransferase involved in cell wall biosynthesis